MKVFKIIKIFLLVISLLFCLTACTYKRGIILFNTQPITRENALQNQKVFAEGQRVYYLFIAPEKMDNEFIRVQVLKMTEDAPWGGNEVVRTKDYRLMLDERYYHTNYFTLYEKGRYVMQVFSHEDFQHPLALCDFYVK